MTLPRPHATLLLAVPALLAAGIAFSQDKPDRPPWAQKPKSNSSSKSKSGSDSTTTAPASAPDGEPGKIVQPTPSAAATDPQDPSGQRGRIRVNVNLVSVLVSVLDDKNRPAPDLPKEAFQLFEEGVEQQINKFEPETSQPLDLAIMIDASLSAHKEISFEQEAAAHFIRQVLRPGDRLAVFSFDENVTQLATFSDNVPELQAAVRKMPAGAGTSIYDAVLLGARALERRGEDRRRVIIMVTDAGETTSRADFDAARKEAVLSNALLYTIVIRPVKNESGRNTAGEHALETMTDTTGGAMFYPDSPQELGAIFDRIDRELRTQYLLAYYPTPRGPANTYRSIVVTVDPSSYHVRHRKTYLTGPQ
ncbi:MAG TPA: VWA domain-containing protein [Candidatus Acidoferrum sp.]